MSSSGTNVNQVEPMLIKWNQVESTLQNIQHSTLKMQLLPQCSCLAYLPAGPLSTALLACLVWVFDHGWWGKTGNLTGWEVVSILRQCY